MKLGDKVKDTLSGFEGTLVTKVTQFGGQIRFQVEGVDKDGLPKGYYMDEPQLEIVKASATDRTPIPTGTIQIGNMVEEVVTKWSGACTGVYQYLNGCVRYGVQGLNKQTGMPEFLAFDEAMLRVLPEPTIERTAPSRSGGEHGFGTHR